MNIKKVILLSICVLISINLSAQDYKGVLEVEGINKRRAVAAKLLVEHDKTPKANNRNNGRSNDDKCCRDEISAPSDYQVLAFGLDTHWYLFDQNAGDVGIPNPIPYLASIASDWEATLYSHNVQLIGTKAAYVQDNEVLVSIDGLANGRYFIEIEHDGNYYSTGFSIGPTTGLPNHPINKASTKTADLKKRRTVAAMLLDELDNMPKANNNNNGRSNKDRCCGGIITAPSNQQLISFGLSTNWYLWEEIVGDGAIPNPIPFLASITSNWEATLYNQEVQVIGAKAAYVDDNEVLININGLANGKYFIEIEHDGNYYSTGFSVGKTTGGIKPQGNTSHK